MNKNNKIKKNKVKGKNNGKKLSIAVLVIEVIVVLILAFVIAMLCIPDSKMKLIKSFTSCSAGQGLISCFLGSDYEKYIQDSDFDEDSIKSNVTLSGEFTNIALFGVDEDKKRTDSIIVLSINNKTGEMKMVSVYRDTVLEYISDDYNGRDIFYYDKANQAYAIGGAECAINMLNSNLDLNIKDYLEVDFAGLANIVNTLGGLDLYVSEEEKYYINRGAPELGLNNGEVITDITEADKVVHLTGSQVTTFSRIRSVDFNFEGVTYNNDYGRTERQRYVIEQIFIKAKSLGAREMLNLSKALFKQNTGSNKFMKTSLSMNEVVQLIPLLLEFNIAGSKGFPIDMTSGDFAPAYITSYGEQGSLYGEVLSCVFAIDLEKNVSKLHKYLFNEIGYEPTENVEEISENLKSVTGIE